MNYKFLITILFVGLIGLIGIISPIGVFAASNTTLDFDGGDDYVVANDNAVFDQANRLSISVWIQPDTAPGDEYIVYRFNHYHLKINSSREIVGSVNTDAARVTSGSAITCDGSAWTHIELTYDKDAGGTDEIKLYINGVLDSVGDYSTAISSVLAEKLYVGASDLDGLGVGAVSNWFDGKIDDVRLYQYARSASDVRLDYNDGLAVRLGGSQTSNFSGSLTSAGCSLDPASCMDYGLVASYDMDEGDGQTLYNAADTGSANDGRLGSSAVADTADPKWTTAARGLTSHSSGGQTSTSLQFDGVNDYVNCGNDDSLKVGTGNVTVSAWFKTNVAPGATITDSASIFSHGYDPGYILLLRGGAYNGILFRTRSALGYFDVKPSSDIISEVSNGIWHYVVGVRSGTSQFLYLDGQLVGSNTGTIYDTTATVNLIGKTDYATNAYFNGTIDSVRIYNRALSAEEVRYHYNRGGPVAHWRFDEGEGQIAFDETGNNNDGTLGASSAAGTDDPAWVTGKHGSALNFDGVNDYVNCGNDPSLDITDAITIEAWVKPETVAGEGILDKLYNDGTYHGYYLRINTAGKVSGWVGNGASGTSDIEGNSVLSTGQWYHVVYTFDGSNEIAYLDGVLDKSETPAVSAISPNNNNVLIGKTRATEHFFNGTIDDVRIYNYARSPLEILKDYNAGLAVHLK